MQWAQGVYMDTFISVMARPFIVLGLLLMAWFISTLLDRVIPEGKIKQALYKRR